MGDGDASDVTLVAGELLHALTARIDTRRLERQARPVTRETLGPR